MHDTRRARRVLGVLIVAALVLIALSYQSGSSAVAGGIGKAGTAVLGEAESAASSAGRLFSRSSSAGSSGQVQALQEQVIRLRAQLAREQLSQADYAELHRLLALAGQGGYRIVAATAIATAQGFQQKVTLDAGSADGVRPQETVMNGLGLVGQVTAVTAHTATVLLASDSSSQVGVELAPGGQAAFVTGLGKAPGGTGQLELQVLDGGVVLRPGEEVVTAASISDRPFVPGVPVGVISSVQNRAGALTARALVRPYVNFASLGIVGIVVVPPRRDPRFSVLPPVPKARPGPTVTVTVAPRARSGGVAAPGGRPSGSHPAGRKPGRP
ncbi:MAG: rod shape-determining protein MreC [Streptosporangiaceae bacterium]